MSTCDLTVLLLNASNEAAQSKYTQTLASVLKSDLQKAIDKTVSVKLSVLDPSGQESCLMQPIDLACVASPTVLILPAEMQIDLFAKRALADAVTWARRKHMRAKIFYDSVTPCHPLLLEALTDEVLLAAGLWKDNILDETSIVLAASGQGDPEVRADAYKLMRLIWEQTRAAWGEAAFLRHHNPMLVPVLKRLAPQQRLIVAAHYLWPCAHYHYTQTIASDVSHQFGSEIPVTRPLFHHPNIAAWFRQRALDMWWEVRLKTQRPMLRLSGNFAGTTLKRPKSIQTVQF